MAAQAPDRPFVAAGDPKRKVEFIVEVGAKGSSEPSVAVVKDYTQFAALPKRLPEAQARATAYHEAGHAVVNDPEVTGQKLTWLTILGDVGNLGFALYDEDEDRPVHVVDRRRAVLRVQLVQYLGNVARPEDLVRVRKLERLVRREVRREYAFRCALPPQEFACTTRRARCRCRCWDFASRIDFDINLTVMLDCQRIQIKHCIPLLAISKAIIAAND